jgi:hypothetical protein
MSFKPRTVTVRLYQGDFQQRIAELEDARRQADKALDDARKRKPVEPRLLHDTGNAEEIEALSAKVAEYDAALESVRAEAEADGSVTSVTMSALPRRRWADLVKQYPPRDGKDVPEAIREADASVGVNDETFGEALVPASIQSISDEDLSVDELLEAISDAQFQMLYANAFALNRALGADPKGPPRLQPSLSSAATEN